MHLTACLTLALASTAIAGDATFNLIAPGQSVDMSPDGTWVVGNDGGGGFIWSMETGLMSIGNTATAVSADGSVVLGQMEDPDTGLNAAGLWTMDTGWVSLGGLPDGAGGCSGSISSPYDLDNAGAIAVGLAWDGCADAVAFTWNETDGMVALPQLGINSHRANGISGDGTHVGGWDEADNGPRRAAIWFPNGTESLILEGTEGNAEGIGEVYAFGTDGAYAVGSNVNPLGGFRWSDQEGGNVDIISPLDGTDPFQFSTIGLAVADDGSDVYGVNISGFGPFAQWDALYWDSEGGSQKLADVLVAAGAELPEGYTLGSAVACSPDGSIVCGWAYQNFIFDAEFFIATFPTDEPEPCSADLNGDGVVDGADLGLLLGAWGPCDD